MSSELLEPDALVKWCDGDEDGDEDEREAFTAIGMSRLGPNGNRCCHGLLFLHIVSTSPPGYLHRRQDKVFMSPVVNVPVFLSSG